MSDDSTRLMPPNNPGTGQTGNFDRTMVATGAVQQMSAGATMQMPASGLNDPYRTQMGGTTSCPVCKATTPQMESFCGECGYLLTSAPVEGLEVPQEEIPAAELIAEADGQRHKLRQGVNTIGRQGTDVLVNEGTLSRVHARITIEGTVITVEDLGSTNGTKVGDKRIGANQPTTATPGTTVRFGNWRALLQLGGLPAGNLTGNSNAATTLMGGNQTMVMGAENRPIIGLATNGQNTNATMVYQSGDLDPAHNPAAVVQNATVLEPVMQTYADGAVIARLTPTAGPGTEIRIIEGTITLGRRPGNTIVISNDAYISGQHAQIETDDTGTHVTDVGSTNGSSVNGQKLSPNERQLLLEGDEVQFGQTKYVFALAVAEAAPSASIMPPSTLDSAFGSHAASPDGSPPGQEFGAINDSVYPPHVDAKDTYHAVDNERPD